MPYLCVHFLGTLQPIPFELNNIELQKSLELINQDIDNYYLDNDIRYSVVIMKFNEKK
jgi:hypothetical protein